MIKKIDLDNFLFLLLLTAFLAANSLIHLATILISLRSLYILLKNKKKSIFLKNIPIPILYSLALFFIFAAITNLLKIDDSEIMSKSFREYKWILVFLSYVYFLSNCFKRKWINHIYIILIFSSIIALYSIAQFFIGFDPLGGHRIFMGSSFPFRAIGFFGIPITFSYMIGGLFFLFIPYIYDIFNTLSKTNKFLVSSALVLMFITLLTTQTRISWVSFYFVFIMLSLCYLKKFRVLAIISVLLIPMLYFIAPQNLQSRITSVFDTKSDGANKGRIYIWKAHSSLFKENPLLGNGTSNYKKYVKNFYIEHNITKTPISHAHNTFLHILSSQGILGFIPFLIFYFYFLFLAFKNTSIQDPLYKNISLGAFASLIFLYIGGLTEVLIIDSETIHLLSFLWSIVVCIKIKNSDNLDTPTTT